MELYRIKRTDQNGNVTYVHQVSEGYKHAGKEGAALYEQSIAIRKAESLQYLLCNKYEAEEAGSLLDNAVPATEPTTVMKVRVKASTHDAIKEVSGDEGTMKLAGEVLDFLVSSGVNIRRFLTGDEKLPAPTDEKLDDIGQKVISEVQKFTEPHGYVVYFEKNDNIFVLSGFDGNSFISATLSCPEEEAMYMEHEIATVTCYALQVKFPTYLLKVGYLVGRNTKQIREFKRR